MTGEIVTRHQAGAVQRAASMQVSLVRYSLRALVEVHIAPGGGTGTIPENAAEVMVDAPFPLWFIDRPRFSFGGELETGYHAEVGRFPSVSAVVATWTTQVNGGGTYYRGARVACVLGGSDKQRQWVHLHFEGKAVRDPVVLTQLGTL